MAAEQPHLLMVYNAKGGLFAAMSDALHKAFSPTTYPCSLCAVTYGAVSKKPAWRRFIRDLPARVTFHHRDDFTAAWPHARCALPAILLEERGKLRVLVDAPELDRMDSVGDLTALVAERLDQAQRV